MSSAKKYLDDYEITRCNKINCSLPVTFIARYADSIWLASSR